MLETTAARGLSIVEVPRGTSTTTRPDPEVPARAKRRRFSSGYKLRTLDEADAYRAPGEVGTLLRRKELYSSQLTQWRRARREMSLNALFKPRGPKGRGRRRERAAAQGKRAAAATAGTVADHPQDPKKASEILGIPLDAPPSGDDI